MEERVKEELKKLKQNINWEKQILVDSEIEQNQKMEIITTLKKSVKQKEKIASSIERGHLSIDVFRYFLAEKTSGVNYAICHDWHEKEKKNLQQERSSLNQKVFIGLIMTSLSFGANFEIIKNQIQSLLNMIPEDGIEKGLLSLTLMCALYTLRKLKQLEITDPDWKDIKALEEEYLSFYTNGPKKKKSL